MYATTLPPPVPSQSWSEPREPSLDRLFEALSAAQWHTHALAERLPSITALADGLTPARRTGWLDGLHQAWQRQGWAMAAADRLALMRLAAGWADWPLVAGVGEQLAADGELPDDDRLTLAHAWRRLGEGGSAVDHARRYLIANPRCETGLDEYAETLRWREFRTQYDLDEALIGDGEGLMLELLVPHHLEDYAWQYFDPAIAELCCLPHFEDDHHWQRWLDETYGYGDQLPFAILHREWGFIGVVSLILQGDVGFFYYWLGTDFQGHGVGPRAAALLLDTAAERWGMSTCYAKVFDYNTPSRKALEKIGFQALGIRAAPPNEEEIFYRVGAPAGHEQTVAQLHTLLERMGSSTIAAAPLS